MGSPGAPILNATTQVDLSGITGLKAQLAILQEQYRSVSTDIRQSVNRIVDAEKQATEAIAAGHTTLAAALEAAANSERTSLDGLIAKQLEVKAALDEISSSSRHAVSEIQATSGALRTFEGTGGIRAAERFLTTIPGLGAALQVAFPVIGAIALGEAIDRVAEKYINLKQRVEDAAKAQEAADKALEADLGTIERVQAALLSLQFGAGAGKKLEAFYAQRDADADIDRVRALNEQVKLLESQASGFHLTDLVPHYGGQVRQGEQADIAKLQADQVTLQSEAEKKHQEAILLTAQATQTLAEEQGRAAAAEVANRQQAADQEAEIARAWAQTEIDESHRVQQARIAAIHDPATAAREAAQEEIRVAQEKRDQLLTIDKALLDETIANIRAKAAAESQGKDQPAQAEVQIRAAGEIAAAKNRYALDEINLTRAVSDAQAKAATLAEDQNKKAAEESAKVWEAFYDAIGKNSEKLAEITDKQVTEQINSEQRLSDIQAEGQAKLAEISEKGAGATQALEIEKEKLEVQRQEALAVNATGADKVKWDQEILAIENQVLQAKLNSIAAELHTAEAALQTALADEKTATTEQQKIKALEEEYHWRQQIGILQNQLTQQAITLQNKEFANQTKVLQQAQAGYNIFFNTITQGFQKSADDAILQNRRWQQDLEQILTKLVLDFINYEIKRVIQHIAANSSIQAADTALMSILRALHLVSATTAQATQSTQAAAQITSDAAVGAAGAAAAVAPIPFIGPALAPEAAAGTEAFILSFIGQAALETGTNYVPKQGLYQLHQGEAVVPRQYNPAAGGTAPGNTYNVTQHIQGGPQHSAEDIANMAVAKFQSIQRRQNRFVA